MWRRTDRANLEKKPRRLCRERKVLIVERVRHVNRVKGLLFSQGISGYEPLRRDRRRRLDTLQTGDGRLLPVHLKAQVCRELDRLELLLEQIKAVEAERDALLAAQQVAAPAPAAMLLNIKGIGPEFAAILWSEGLFRHFDNRRQVASYAGLAPTPWQSGSVDREQGVSKAGNPRLRTTLIQLAWLWLRHQPQSALALWFEERVRRNGGRLKKTTIVALARKLLVALWKYVTAGVVIEGAMMKRLTINADRSLNLPGPDQSWRIQVDEPHPHGLKSRLQEWSRPPEPRPPQAGYWCSRFARRPNVRLIVRGNEQVMQSGSDLGYRTATGDLRMSP